jgi:DNA-binding response OmpR family regulator
LISFLLITGCLDSLGQELTTEIRKFDKNTPILFYPGAAYETDKQKARDAGAQGYLIKPLGISDLVDEVARLIAEAKIAFPVAIDLP